MTSPHTATSLLAATTMMSAPDTSTTAEQGILTDLPLVTRLLDFGQVLCQKMQSKVADICYEVRRITQDRAYLHLGCERLLTWQQIPSHTWITIPVQFGHVSYGALCIICDPAHTDLPSIPLPVARLFAQACSWLLYTFEQSTFLQGQCQQFEYQVQGPLTKREREVLQMMYQGFNREEITDRLSIAPATLRKHRQHIYEQLGVHNERDALLAAYHGGLLSPFEEIPS
ncbi:MAG: helix-turn-helix transcriptional regulator [Ktedonobacteraceae bacterium]